MNHTPGPWKVKINGNTVKSCAVVGSDGTSVCASISPKNDNARLIAAAPDLLYALENILNACYIADANGSLSPDIDGSFLDGARYAIAKATGSK